ncbi:MAG: hypothetical protein H0W22_08605, partial [Chloroflexi bacterium]|nr:hypothetical protein [Chloroflexota bacterium]
MAILAALFAFGSRFVGKILTTALGWASTLLFGRVPAKRQYLLVGITFGSVIWIVLLAGVVFPDIGTFLLVFVPDQDIIPEDVIRLVMLAGAAIVPAVIGGLTLMLASPVDRSERRIGESVLRGYPLTVLLAVLLIFLAGLAIVRKAQSLAKGWTDAHVPMAIEPGKYDEVASDLDQALETAGLEVAPKTASAAMSKPAKWLAAVAGGSAGVLVPEKMIQLDGKDLDILIYPMDILISGKPRLVARARAAMASRLTTSAAHLTVSAEAQGIEDRLAALARPETATPDHPARFDDAAAAEFTAIDAQLATLEIPYEEWEVLYRQRLQVERDLRAGAMAGDAVVGADTPGVKHDGALGTLGDLGRLVKAGAGAVIEAAADERTGQMIDRISGPQWRWVGRA